MRKPASNLVKNNSRLLGSIIVTILVLVAVGFFISDDSSHKQVLSACGFRNDKTVTINSHKISVEVADNNQARMQGLSGRKCIGQNEGMLFVFSRSGYYQFWMKDMKFPIDIIWIAPDHQIVGLKGDALPSSYPQKYVNQSKAALYVLELAPHKARNIGVGPGTTVNF